MKENLVILVGGVYGSGKSTVASALGEQASVVDYDQIIGNTQGKVMKPEELAPIRQLAWSQLFLEKLRDSAKNNRATIGVGTFTTRERRDRYFEELSAEAQVIGLYYMLPMKTTIERIKLNRASDHLVNGNTVIDFYRAHNQTFKTQDHGDLLLPSDPSTLPLEYRALLQQSKKDFVSSKKRWVVLPKPLDPATIKETIASGTTDSEKIRALLEGKTDPNLSYFPQPDLSTEKAS